LLSRPPHRKRSERGRASGSEGVCIHIAKRRRDPANFNLPALAKATEGFSGRQIEQVWLKALTRAFNDSTREPVNEDAVWAAKQFVATSITMAEVIEARRKRLQGRATPASRPPVPKPSVPGNGVRKLAVSRN
jgi:SpoVK/Ycf46/Vps4 family AAA+-type ATPase